MNERIKQLIEQAGFQYIKDEGIGWAGDYNASLPKFAEFIVRECAKAAYLYTSDSKNYEHYDNMGWDCLPGDLQSHIKEHFGVEQ